MCENECSICASTGEKLICPFIMEGTGAAWPVKPDGEMDSGKENKKPWKQLRAKPVKVMDNYVCGDCRVQMLPRVMFLAQQNRMQDLMGKELQELNPLEKPKMWECE